jgi:hypothetical protein
MTIQISLLYGHCRYKIMELYYIIATCPALVVIPPSRRCRYLAKRHRHPGPQNNMLVKTTTWAAIVHSSAFHIHSPLGLRSFTFFLKHFKRLCYFYA